MDTSNGVATSYLQVEGIRYSNKGQSRAGQEAPPSTSATIKVDVSANGHVVLYVVEPSRNRALQDRFFDITKVDIPKRKANKIKVYKKPVGHTNNVGPGAPILWPSIPELPERIRQILSENAAKLVIQAKPGQAMAVQNALSKIGVSAPSRTQSPQPPKGPVMAAPHTR